MLGKPTSGSAACWTPGERKCENTRAHAHRFKCAHTCTTHPWSIGPVLTVLRSRKSAEPPSRNTPPHMQTYSVSDLQYRLQTGLAGSDLLSQVVGALENPAHACLHFKGSWEWKMLNGAEMRTPREKMAGTFFVVGTGKVPDLQNVLDDVLLRQNSLKPNQDALCGAAKWESTWSQSSLESGRTWAA